MKSRPVARRLRSRLLENRNDDAAAVMAVYPFSPVRAMPSMKVRCAKKKSRMMGRMLMHVAAMIQAKFEKP